MLWQTVTEATSRRAVLLVNLGTPQAPTTAALRRYLAEFLSDPRVVDYHPRWWWWLILHGVILRLRPRRSAEAYRKIWTEAGSPLRVHSEALAEALAAALATHDETGPRVALAMRYGEPAIGHVLAGLRDEGIDDLVVLPLYPQFSRTTTASTRDAVDAALARLGWSPRLHFVHDYHDDDAWLDAMAAQVRAHWQTHGRGERLLLSFHGIPERYVREGDPYLTQCLASAEALRQRLRLGEDEAIVCFQSRVGREPWLEPYTDETVKQLGAKGVKRIDVICPGFAVDCLETLEEIALRYRDQFLAAGGEELRYVPALNASPAHAEALARLVASNT
jgi:ferrochelatase